MQIKFHLLQISIEILLSIQILFHIVHQSKPNNVSLLSCSNQFDRKLHGHQFRLVNHML